MSDLDTVTSVEQDGRVLSGAGASVEQLEAVMERHAPEPETVATAGPAAPTAESAAAVSTPAPEPKPSRGAQRFADLTKARDEASARAEAAEKRAAELEAKIAAPPAAHEPEPAKPAAAKPAEKFTFPEYVDYATEHPDVSYSEWELARLDARDAWRDAHSDINGRVSEALARERAEHDSRTLIASTHVKGRAAYADFDAVLKSGPGAAVDLGPTAEQARARVAAIYGHPQTEHLQYAIMKDADLAKRLASLDDIGFGIEIARLVAPTTPRPRAAAPPPAPYAPVNGGSTSTTATASSELSKKGYDFDKSGYREKRAAERGVKTRR